MKIKNKELPNIKYYEMFVKILWADEIPDCPEIADILVAIKNEPIRFRINGFPTYPKGITNKKDVETFCEDAGEVLKKALKKYLLGEMK